MVRALVGDSTMTRVDMGSFVSRTMAIFSKTYEQQAGSFIQLELDRTWLQYSALGGRAVETRQVASLHILDS